MTVAFVAPRVPLVDVRTGTITREWYLLFQGLFGIVGGETDPDAVAPIGGASDLVITLLDRIAGELALAPPSVPAAPVPDNLTPPSLPLFIPADDVLPVIGALRDEVAMLRREIDDLRKGVPVL